MGWFMIRSKEPLIKLKVYMKNQKKPITLILDNQKQVDQFYAYLDNDAHRYIKFGQLILDKEEFRFAVKE